MPQHRFYSQPLRLTLEAARLARIASAFGSHRFVSASHEGQERRSHRIRGEGQEGVQRIALCTASPLVQHRAFRYVRHHMPRHLRLSTLGIFACTLTAKVYTHA